MSTTFMRKDKFLHTSHIACWFGTLGSVLAMGIFAPNTYGQIVPDTTTSSVASLNNDLITITGGVRSGNVLFHSFDQFSVSPGQRAQFANALDLNTLIARITGLQSSVIEGTLAAQGNADVFLLNPNGIVFGANAELDIGGSFIATTADSILFDNGQQFSAVAPQGVPLLSISTPIGLQYGENPHGIEVLGNGHGLIIDPFTLEVVPTAPRTGLRVPTGHTLALLGGDVTLNGGNLTASEGRVVLLGAGSGSKIALEEDLLGWSVQQSEATQLEATQVETGQVETGQLTNVALFNAASILTSGRGGGAVHLEGQRIDVLDGSTILANTSHAKTGNGVTVRATEAITLQGVALDSTASEALFPSSIFSEVEVGATGKGGDVHLMAPTILVADGAQVSTSVFGDGHGGNLLVQGDQVKLSGGTTELGSSGFFLSVADPLANGTGGDFSLQADYLLIDNGAIIDSSNFGLGDSGDIVINASMVELKGRSGELAPSRVLSQVEGEGNGGNITIMGDILNISAGANLSTIVFGQGEGGDINVLVDSVHLKNGIVGDDSFPSGLFSSLEQDSSGRGGDINMITRHLRITEGGGIDSSTASDQNAGNVRIQAQSVDLIGQENAPTGILSSVAAGAMGLGGKIDIQTETLTVRNGAQIVTGTLGLGNANDLQVNANNIVLDGRNNFSRSGLFSSALESTGNGGTILIKTDSLDVQNGATINASNFPSLNGIQLPGQGAAGSIYVKANITRIRNQGTITTATFAGDEGNINLESDVVLLRNNSTITTNASQAITGGNIMILSDFLVGVAAENSDITANSQQGQGGRIEITAQGVYGFGFPGNLTPVSDITASSDIGLNGVVEVYLLSTDLSNGLGPLPNNFEERDDQISSGCSANQGANFVATGRGGLPSDLAQQVDSLTLLPSFERGEGAELVEDMSVTGNNAVQTAAIVGAFPEEDLTEEALAGEELAGEASAGEESFVEAQGWMLGPNGTVVLVAAGNHDVSHLGNATCMEAGAV